MPVVPRPRWEPLPEPPGIDPALAQDFQVLAANHTAELDDAGDSTATDQTTMAAATDDGQAAAARLGLDLARAADEIDAVSKAADGVTLSQELSAAVEQDRALDGIVADVSPAWPVE
jgi:hypothetical protein